MAEAYAHSYEQREDRERERDRRRDSRDGGDRNKPDRRTDGMEVETTAALSTRGDSSPCDVVPDIMKDAEGPMTPREIRRRQIQHIDDTPPST